MSKNLLFLHEYFPFGGGEKVTSILSEYFLENGYNVFIACKSVNKSKLSDLLKEKLIFTIIPNQDHFDSNENNEHIVNFIAQQKIDCIIIQGIFSRLGEFIKHNNIACKIIYAHHGKPMWESVNGLILKEREIKKAPIVKRLKWIVKDKSKFVRESVAENIDMYNKQMATADAFVVLCEAYISRMASLVKDKQDIKKISAISNPLKKIAIGVPIKKKQILFVGRLSFADKRIDRVVELWKSLHFLLPDWNMTIVGEGPDEERIKDLIKTFKLPRITLEGHREDVSPYYKESSILCLTSNFEGYPMVLMEAQQFGVIPFSFESSEGVKDIITDGVTGFLVKPYNMKSYKNKLLRLALNEELQQQVSKNVILKAQDYDVAIKGQQWINLFNE